MIYQPSSTHHYFYTQNIIRIDFPSNQKFYTWHMTPSDLNCFVRSQYITRDVLYHLNIHCLQEPFRYWYNKTVQHEYTCPRTAFHPRMTVNQAISYVFNENLCPANRATHIPRNDDIICMVNHCLAITKLSMIIELDWTMETS